MGNATSLEKFVIRGGKPLNGEVIPAGNKNSVLPIICASVMASEPVTLENVPDILDVQVLSEIFEALGGKVTRNINSQTLILDPTDINSYTIPAELASRLRASNLFFGPLWSRFGKVEGAHPGGDRIGPREMAAHYISFEALGGNVSKPDNKNKITISGKPKGGDIFLYDPSVTATENAIMSAVFAKGTTTIENAACEPHVQELCNFLRSIGGEIEGCGTNKIVVRGVDRLSGTKHRIWSDHIDIGTTIIMAAVTEGTIRIKHVQPEHLKTILFSFKTLGLIPEFDGDDLVVKDQKLRVRDRVWGRIKGIYSQPWPGFPTDLMSPTIVLATQTEGTTLLFEKMYSGRMYFSQYLNGMGANIIMCDPHRIVVSGKTPLKSQKLVAPDLRAGMAFIIAGLLAEGETVIDSVYHVDRGYPNVENRLKKLGAEVERVAELN